MATRKPKKDHTEAAKAEETEQATTTPADEETTAPTEEQAAADAEETTAPTDEEPKTEETEKKDDEFAGIPNPFVYCGPSVRGVARQYTTFQGGIPQPMKDFIRQHPTVRHLIVSTGKFAAVRRKLETIGTAEYIIYKQLKSEL